MEFKIDTKENYTHIRPKNEVLDANMAAGLTEKCTELSEAGSQNFLIDLGACQSAEPMAFEPLALLHETCYSNGQSIVFTGLQPAVSQTIKEEQMESAINIAPTEIEAIDIISMEILERDLFNEES